MRLFSGVFLKMSSYMRLRRFRHVNEMITAILARKGRCNILDIGGSVNYWKINEDFLARHGDAVTIMITNIDNNEIQLQNSGQFAFKQGDASDDMLYAGDYDLIHSNSVIEHVGNWLMLQRIANLIRKQNTPYYIQTPNYWFPVEPHFRFIGFQWLPASWRARILLKHPLGLRRADTFDDAMESVESINLLDRFQMTALFPNAKILSEKVGPLTKSFMAIKA